MGEGPGKKAELPHDRQRMSQQSSPLHTYAHLHTLQSWPWPAQSHTYLHIYLMFFSHPIQMTPLYMSLCLLCLCSTWLQERRGREDQSALQSVLLFSLEGVICQVAFLRGLKDHFLCVSYQRALLGSWLCF